MGDSPYAALKSLLLMIYVLGEGDSCATGERVGDEGGLRGVVEGGLVRMALK